MPTVLTAARQRLLPLVLTLALAVVVGGADGCSSDPNVEGARLYIRNNELPQALEALDRAMAANPDNVEALVLRADVRRRQADAATDGAERQRYFDQMEADVARATQLAPTDADVITMRTNGWITAVTKGNQALVNQNVERSVSQGHFRTAVNLLPDSSQGHYGLGLAYLTADDAASAVAPLRRALELSPGNESTHLYLGRALLLSDQATEGVAVLQAAGDRFPDNADIQNTLLNAYAMGGNTEEALARYERAVQESPDNALLFYNYGALLLRAERYDEAIAQLERATELDPTSGDAHYNLGAAIQNKAAALTRRANETEDNAEANRLIAERDALLVRSLGPLVRAREIAAGVSDAEGERTACNALFQVYGQLNRASDAAEVAACAGQSMN